MAAKVKSIPKGYHTVTPYLVLNDCARALDFYRNAFGAQEVSRMDGPGGKVMHAEIRIGDSMIMLSDEMPGSACRSPQSLGGTTTSIFLYVDDVDSFMRQAQNAGARIDMPAADMFWGDRYGKLTDPFGHSWGAATHKEDVAPDEMKKRAQAFMAQMAQQSRTAS
jgi:PhnB protein